jgi:single-strand DNA-binding protein
MASTRRWFDHDKGVWADGRTEWFTVKSWRSAARNVAESLRKGDPVVVHGRLSTEEWSGPEGIRTNLVLDAIAIGPDLAYGSARYARTVHPSGADPDGAGEGADVVETEGEDELEAEPDPLDGLEEEELAVVGSR